jgi:hypothetical protein
MITGEYALFILGNNADGDPFAWQRNVFITAGTQATLTVSPQITTALSSPLM